MMMVYELKITLEDVGAPVSRKVHIKKDASFYELHELIQAVFDWTASHLYGFYVVKSNGKQTKHIEISGRQSEASVYDSKQIIHYDKKEKLSEWFKKPSDYINYVYDYGDNWEHLIEFIKEIEPNKTIDYPVCIAAENYAPPEDSRFDVMQGSLDLLMEDNHLFVSEVNEAIKNWTPVFDEEEPMFTGDVTSDTEHWLGEEQNLVSEEWEKTFEIAKEFSQRRPWEKLKEQDVFAVKDPESGRFIFCSVIGHSEDQIGITAYIGIEGFLALLEIMSGEEVTLDGLQQGHSLFVTFEDRNDIDGKDYELIKAHSTVFRGKKSWPIFTSIMPGYVPWTMNEEEARLTRLMMTESLNVVDELEKGLTFPLIPSDEKILLRRMDASETEPSNFTSQIVEVEELLNDDGEEEVMLSEFEIKRLNKLTKPLVSSIEFSIVPLAVPIQRHKEERPFFPFVAIAVDEETGEVYYQEMLEEHLDAYYGQKALLHALSDMGGIPETIYTDQRTARLILPLLDVQDFDIGIEHELEMTEELVEGLLHFMMDDLQDQ